MKITIIGAGNTAVAAACFLKTLGLSSLIYTRREERAKQWNQFPVKASGACTGSFSLESTTDLKTAVHYGWSKYDMLRSAMHMRCAFYLKSPSRQGGNHEKDCDDSKRIRINCL